MEGSARLAIAATRNEGHRDKYLSSKSVDAPCSSAVSLGIASGTLNNKVVSSKLPRHTLNKSSDNLGKRRNGTLSSSHGKPFSESILMTSRLLIGRGRDGLIYRFGAANISNLHHSDLVSAVGWGGFVAKIPRFVIPDVPQHYVKSLVGGFANQPRVVDRVRRAMDTNLKAERRHINSLWAHLCDGYLQSIGFPPEACTMDAWRPASPPVNIELTGNLNDDGKTIVLNSMVPTNQCHLMPEALLDGFQAMVHHRTEELTLNFVRDILYQLQWLEDNRIVHGDIKFSNILLLTWNHNSYVFILADFWDAFTLSSNGNVDQLDPKRSHPDYDMRKLQRWKFHYEKFGTRLYKDPELLDSLREAVRARRDQHSDIRNWEHLTLDAGPINMWSFMMMFVFLLSRKSKVLGFKSKVRDEILFSGSASRPPLRASVAMQLIRDHAIQINKPSTPSSAVHGLSKRLLTMDKGSAQAKSNTFSSELREKLYQFIGPSNVRPSAFELIRILKLYDPSRTPPDARNIEADLGFCAHPEKCRVCHYSQPQN